MAGKERDIVGNGQIRGTRFFDRGQHVRRPQVAVAFVRREPLSLNGVANFQPDDHPTADPSPVSSW